MFPNPRRTIHGSHIYADQEVPILKQTAIYGANGSGKSNLVKALSFIREFVTRIGFLDAEIVETYEHKLAGDDPKPIEILVEFLMNNAYYIYETEISRTGVDKEALYLSGIGKRDNEVIFLRTVDKIELASSLSKEMMAAVTKLLSNNKFSSVLSLNEQLPILNDDRVDGVFDWFNVRLDVVSPKFTIPWLINFLDADSDLFAFVRDAFTKIGLGIDSVFVRTEAYEDWVGKNGLKLQRSTKKVANLGSGLTSMEGDKPLFSTAVEDGEKKVKEIVFRQLGKDGYAGELGIDAQSDGTCRLLVLIPAIFEAVTLGHVVVIDEIEHSIHPILVRALVDYFAKSQTNGQLIFTTHETCLLNQGLLRPDEVWFMEKTEGTTRMYSLNDFKVHHTISIENGYLEGRYGAIPFIGEL